MKLIDLANSIWYSDLLQVSDTSIPQIITYLKDHIGDLNNLIATDYTISNNDADPELGYDEAAILAQIYLEKYYQRQIKNNLGASQYDWSEVQEADSKVRRVSKNEIAKTYKMLANDIRDNLYKMAEHYRRWKCVPASFNLDCILTAGTVYQRIQQSTT